MVTFDHREPGTPEEDWARCGALHRAPELELSLIHISEPTRPAA